MTIYYQDNLKILSSLPDECVDFIYIDPPFNTWKVQERKSLDTIRDKNGDCVGYQGKRYKTFQVNSISYRDIFDDYLGFLEVRLRQARRILRANGSIFVHKDY